MATSKLVSELTPGDVVSHSGRRATVEAIEVHNRNYRIHLSVGVVWHLCDDASVYVLQSVEPDAYFDTDTWKQAWNDG